MLKNIKVEQLRRTLVEKQEVETVERKCIGHFDSIAGGPAE